MNLQNNKTDLDNKLSKNITVTFLGGIREVGRNATVYTVNDDMFLIDCGVSFKNPAETGFRYLLPDLNFLYENKDKIRAIIITHGHEDHIGGLIHLFKLIGKVIPIYAGQFVCELLKEYFKPEKGDLFNEIQKNIVPIRNNTVVQFQHASFKFVHITHSTPDSYFVYIYGSFGTVLHTGDWKFDLTPVGKGNDFPSIISSANGGVDVLVCDSTRCTEKGISETEQVVINSFNELFASHAKKRIFAVSFGSNVNRVIELVALAQRHNRKVFLCGHSMQRNVMAALNAGMIRNIDIMANTDKINTFNGEEVFVLCTGTQGEPEAAIGKIASGNHKHIKAGPEDVFAFSSDIIPGCEKSVFASINGLMLRGATVIHRMLDEKYRNFHVSGHGSSKDIHMLFNLVQPKFFIPVHGEYHHMYANKKNAIACGMPEEHVILASNGDNVVFDGNECYIDSSINFRPILLDDATYVVSPDTLKTRTDFLSKGAFICIFDKRSLTLAHVELLATSSVFLNNYKKLFDCIYDKTKGESDMDKVSDTIVRELCREFVLKFEELPEIRIIVKS